MTKAEVRQQYIDHVEQAVERAKNQQSQLNSCPSILKMEGGSSPRVRHLMNNLVNAPFDVSYLEVGLYKGSTFTAALYKNSPRRAVGVDNWSQFQTLGNNKDTFLAQTRPYIDRQQYSLVEGDAFKLDLKWPAEVPPNIYLYDGAHDYESQRLAISFFQQALADPFILIVDDFNDRAVQEGTWAALRECGYRVFAGNILPARFNGDGELWHSGLFVGVLQTGLMDE